MFNLDKMTYENYFIFVCIFMFYDVLHIAMLMLSMINIFTSDYIKVEEISLFYSEYEINHNLVEICALLGIERNKDPECPLDSYLLSDFLIHLNKSKKFVDFIEEFRMKLIKVSISRGLYESIVSKCNYFYANPNCISYPSESCLGCVYRKLQGLPKPYYSEYGSTEPAVYSLSEIISVLRDRYLKKLNISKSPDISQSDLTRMIQLSIIDKPVRTSQRNSLIYSNVVKNTPSMHHRNSVKSLESALKNGTVQTVKDKKA